MYMYTVHTCMHVIVHVDVQYMYIIHVHVHVYSTYTHACYSSCTCTMYIHIALMGMLEKRRFQKFLVFTSDYNPEDPKTTQGNKRREVLCNYVHASFTCYRS